MKYQDTVNWMFKQLPMYQNQGKSAYKANLNNTLELAKYLHHPDTKFKSIHIAGTNGKGSTSHMLASIFQESGYQVGLYTSPHLKDFRERIKINGKEISKQHVIQFIKTHKPYIESHELSFFEMTVGMAFDYFAKQSVDIAIIEVGMGGRLDSTNIIFPEVSVITNIGLDHTQFLGTTLKEIAIEKAGIIKPEIPVVIGETQSETEQVFRDLAIKFGSKIHFADQEEHGMISSDLIGSYQSHNIKTVLQTVKALENNFNISPVHVKEGLLNVVKNTTIKGRWQTLQEHPKIICDTAHNREGLSYTMQQLLSENFEKLHIVFGVVNDKDLSSILTLLPKHAFYYLCKPNIPRGMEVDQLKQVFKANNFDCEAYGSVGEAFMEAKYRAKDEDVIYVGGSTFVVAEII